MSDSVGNGASQFDERYIEELIEQLRGDTRRGARNKLIEIGEAAVLPLLRVLDTKDFVLIGYVAITLGDIGDKRAVQPLIKLLKESWGENRNGYNPVLCWVCVGALGRLKNSQAVEPLLEIFQEEISDPVEYYATQTIRLAAAKALGELGDKRALEPLIRILEEHKDYIFQEAVALALGNLGYTEAIKPLIRALEHDKEPVRTGAAGALGELGAKEAIYPLIKVLEAENNTWACLRAAEALGKLGDKRAIQPLIKALKERYSDLQFEAAKALGILGDKVALPILKQTAWKNPYSTYFSKEKVAISAIRAIKAIKRQNGKRYYAVKRRRICPTLLASRLRWSKKSSS